MTVRADLAELLRAGHSERAIARWLLIDRRQIRKARKTLGLSPAKSGVPAAATPEDLFWRRAKPTDDGHLLWGGSHNSTGVPVLHHGGRQLSAYRVAFRIANGREPVGYAKNSCGVDGCVRPGCVDDQRQRDTFAAIFGGAS